MCKFSAWKAIIQEMECKLVVTKGKNLQPKDQSMYNSCISSWKRGPTKCKFSAWKVIIQEVECKFGCHEREKSSAVI